MLQYGKQACFVASLLPEQRIATCPSQFLASDLGALQYPQYQVHRTQPAFRSRAELLEYEGALSHAVEMNSALEVGKKAKRQLLRQLAIASN